MALAQVYIHDPWEPHVRLAELATAHNIDRSFVLMAPGQASVLINRNDPQLDRDALLLGNVLVISSEDAPPWGGLINSVEEDLVPGVLTINAQGFASILDARVVSKDQVYEASIGSTAIFHSLMESTNARGHTCLFAPSDFELAPSLSNVSLVGQSVLSALHRLASLTGYEWWVEAEASGSHVDFTIRWGYRQGLDLADEVHLWQERHFSQLAYKLDLSQVRQSVTVIGGGGDVRDREAITRSATTEPGRSDLGLVVEPASEIAIRSVLSLTAGLRTERLVLDPGSASQAELSRRGQEELERPLGSGELLSLTVNDTVSWHDLALGNLITIHATLGLGTIQRKVRIVGVQPDEEMGACDLVVETDIR